jgi:hypothetical protein
MDMCGTIPEWVTAAAAVVSVYYLIDYANSARKQVEATSRPIIACEEADHNNVVVFKNVGNGAALNVKWEFRGEEQTRAVFPVGDTANLCRLEDLIMSKSVGLGVTYESLTKRRWRTTALWLKDPNDGIGHVEIRIDEI